MADRKPAAATPRSRSALDDHLEHHLPAQRLQHHYQSQQQQTHPQQQPPPQHRHTPPPAHDKVPNPRSVASSSETSALSASPPSSRITRSSARQAAAASQASSSAGLPPGPSASAADQSVASSHSTLTRSASTRSNPPPSRKRKPATAEDHASPPQPSANEQSSPPRRSKRQKTQNHGPSASEQFQPAAPTPTAAPRKRKGKATATMSSPSGSSEHQMSAALQAMQAALQDNAPSTSASASSSRKSSRHKKAGQSSHASASGPSWRSKRGPNNNATSPDADTAMAGAGDQGKEKEGPQALLPQLPAHDPDADSEEHDDEDDDDDDEDDDDEDEDDERHRNYDEDDPFGGFGGPPGQGLSSTLRTLSGIMSGISPRLRDILGNLRHKADPTVQLIALQDLSELLLVSNEDNLQGHFSPDAFVKELVILMQPNEFTGEESPEIMLVACRCLANLMEALPASAANVVYGGAVPVLCQKLLEIQFIDLAEQALSTLEKISVEYPTSIVREGGLTACLSYLDFFATSTQRTAVTTAANCCRNIPEDSFPVIKDVMPILLNVLGSSDQRVVEQASLCVTRIVESFRHHSSKLEQLVDVDLLRAILRLLVPGTTNLISSSIHTLFLQSLAYTAKASPLLSAELVRLNVVETLYQILTGVSPPNEMDDVASKLDSVVIMQALIHRPREQIIETLNVVCELLPAPRCPGTLASQGSSSLGHAEPTTRASGSEEKKSSSEKRLELLDECKDQVRRFALILFPTLTDAFSSTVNLTVRQKVLDAQLKMLSNLDKDILVDSLKSVPYASFLAAILSQQDHPSLVMSAIQITELLLLRLDHVYRYQIYREGVISEIAKLAAEYKKPETKAVASSPVDHPMTSADSEADRVSIHNDADEDGHDDENHEEDGDEDHIDDDGEEDEDEEVDEDHENIHRDDIIGSPSSDGSTMSLDAPPRLSTTDMPSIKSRIAEAAKRFLEVYETEKHGKAMKKKAVKILNDLQQLASSLEAFYLHRTANDLSPKGGTMLWKQLASHFDADVLESVTSAELLASGLVRVVEEVFSNPDDALANSARAAFLEVFMAQPVSAKPKTATADSPTTPFSVMIHKLQDLLSRSEHFEVLTVHHNALDHRSSSAASMLAKQIKIKLAADEDSDIPRSYRSIMVSIHAIATFKALDDYLRPRINLYERPRGSRPRDGLSRALAAMASSAGLVPPGRLTNHLADRDRLAERLSAAGFPSTQTPPPPPPQASTSRTSRKSRSKQSDQPETPSTPGQTPASGREKAILRRSARRHPAPASETPAPPPPPPPEEDDDLKDALECADEKPITDGDDDDADDDENNDIGANSALDAIVGELDEEMEDAPGPDPTAVNMEVAAGGKITATKEDGTRVPTPGHTSGLGNLPSRSAPPSQFSPAQQPNTPTPTPGPSSRPLSYAAAIQSTPQDWHIEFSLGDRVIPNETTIYRAVHNTPTPQADHLSRSVFSTIHTIKFRRVPGPPPAEPIGFSSPSFDGSPDVNGVPASLADHPTTTSILRLLNILHDLNANIDDIVVENKNSLRLNVEPLSQFVNTKLTAKLNRQLEEPLIVASNCLPSWSEDLARLYPFLFPFETRHLFLQSTSFGYARSMSRWQNAQQDDNSRRDRRDERPFLGRLQRQKVRISRSKILESALKVMDLYGSSQSILEVEYFEEVGTGLGPTLEFYSTVSKEFSKRKLKLWREEDSNDTGEFVSAPNGLFPSPLCQDESSEVILGLFKTLGKFVARSMIDSRIIDIHLNPTFFRIGEGAGVKPSLGAVKIVDPGLANSLKHIKKFAAAKKAIAEDPTRTPAQKVEDTQRIVVDDTVLEELALDFTLPGYPKIQLIPDGSQTPVTIDNVESYLENVIDVTLNRGVRQQVDAFRAGFSQVFPYSALSAFTPDELVTLFGRSEEDWTLETLMDSIKADHGFNMDSRSVKNLLHTMSELPQTLRRDFLQFTTGSPKLPIGGFKSLTPMFTVVCKPSEPPYTSDDYLPSVMTCVNYLKLPDYTTVDTLKRQLFKAIKEGQGAFHLS
ncbi:HECT-domain-containing protein [Astrocystis sublimbata]|nr:HECT-domain-containing protein [Astrocystis sublimbata]